MRERWLRVGPEARVTTGLVTLSGAADTGGAGALLFSDSKSFPLKVSMPPKESSRAIDDAADTGAGSPAGESGKGALEAGALEASGVIMEASVLGVSSVCICICVLVLAM